MKKNRKRTKIKIIAIIQLLYIIVCLFIVSIYFFTIDIHNSIIAKIKLFVKRDVVMDQTVDLPIRFDRDLL